MGNGKPAMETYGHGKESMITPMVQLDFLRFSLLKFSLPSLNIVLENLRMEGVN